LIKEVAEEDDRSEGFRLKEQSSMVSEAELRTLLSPDDVALHDGMLVANYRNADVNRIRATSRDGLKTTSAQQVEKALEYLHGAAMREVVQKVVAELKEAPWYRCTRILTAQPSASRASRDGARDRAWLQKKHNIPNLLRDSVLKQKYGSGTEAEVKQLSNPECRTILKLCGVPDTIAIRQSQKQRWETILKMASQGDSRADAPQLFVQRKLQGPTVDLEQLQREFEAELVEIAAEDAEDGGEAAADEDEDDDMAEEARIMEGLLEEGPSPRATASGGATSAAGSTDKEVVPKGGKRKIVKKRLEFMHPDGTRYRRYELIVDPKEVRDYIMTKKKEKARRAEAKKRHDRRKEQLKSARAQRKHGRGKTKEQEADVKAAELAERTRVINAYKQWNDGGRVGRHVIGRPGKDTQKPCGECGAHGHMRTNKICPLYEEDEFQAPKKAPRRSKPVQEAQGTKLTMSRRDIQPTGLKFSKRRMEEAKEATRAKNRQKQYSAIDDNEYDENYRPRVKRQRAARGTAYMRWCEDVEKLIIEELEREEHATVFMHPVSKKDAPTYHLKITKPVCLRQIRENLRKHGYAEKNQFLADVQLMFDNCREFNRGTASNWLADWADEMQAVFHNLMEQNAPHLNALELQVRSHNRLHRENALLTRSTLLNSLCR
jgi:transcription initiation factor TFIID subunit 1